MLVSRGLIGKKVGMTQIFDKEGNVIPVTVIETGPCTVLSKIEAESKIVKLGFESIKESKLTKPELGFFKKIGVSPLKLIREFETCDNPEYTKAPKTEEKADAKEEVTEEKPAEAKKEEAAKETTEQVKAEEAPKEDAKDAKKDEKKEDAADNQINIGDTLKVNLFRPGDFVDVSGQSKGKGFQGGMKRWGWSGGPRGHGSMHHRRVGSIGASADPSRTFKGRHMPGQMGNARVTVQGLRVMEVDLDNNLILIDGAIPGGKNGFVTINLSKKKTYKSLEEKKAVHAVKRNPMKQSKSKSAGKGK